MSKAGTIVSNKYLLNHLIAVGGMAEVYLAESVDATEPGNRTFAIKRLLPKLARNPIFADLFNFEASLSLSLSHDNIIPCHEYLKDNGELYLVMEFVCGHEIAALWHELYSLSGFERLQVALAVGSAICEALTYIHEKADVFGAHMGIVHGDISSQNIMITTGGKVMLYDFGSAKTSFSSVVFEEMVTGNLSYMSPEQHELKPIDARSDIFSLGLVLLEILGGRPLDFKRNNGFDRVSQVRSCLCSVDAPMGKDSHMKLLLSKALSYHRDDRFFSSRELLSELRMISSKVDLGDSKHFLQELLAYRGPKKLKEVRDKKRFMPPLIACMLLNGGFSLLIWVLILFFTHHSGSMDEQYLDEIVHIQQISE